MNSNDEHKKTDEDQPWNQTFSEDRDENGNLSRVKLRKQSQNHHLITMVLAALIIIVAVVALVYGLVRQSAMGNDSKSAASSSVRVVRQDNAKKKSSSAAKAKSNSAKAKPAVKKEQPKSPVKPLQPNRKPRARHRLLPVCNLVTPSRQPAVQRLTRRLLPAAINTPLSRPARGCFGLLIITV